jgi:ubiquinone/menaquinone biosynthesis C-methylase UbiE
MTKAVAARRVDGEGAAVSAQAQVLKAPVAMPRYLEQTYWWAYVHPNAVRVFERQWLVNLILWGNYNRLRDSVFRELNAPVAGRMLQVACVYGDFTEMLARQLGPQGTLDVADVAPVQIDNLKRKINGHPRVAVHHQDSGDLVFADAAYDYVVLFFLLHEMPEAVRVKTVAEALRVVKPGGKVIFVDYHRPHWMNPFRYLMMPVLKWLEPFAMDLWRREITAWMPASVNPAKLGKRTFFGGLYQKVVITR